MSETTTTATRTKPILTEAQKAERKATRLKETNFKLTGLALYQAILGLGDKIQKEIRPAFDAFALIAKDTVVRDNVTPLEDQLAATVKTVTDLLNAGIKTPEQTAALKMAFVKQAEVEAKIAKRDAKPVSNENESQESEPPNAEGATN